MSAYLQFHHGSFWFQLKVPKSLIGQYGKVVRQNLQTGDRAVARVQAYQMAGQWLSRFQTEKSAKFPVSPNSDSIPHPGNTPSRSPSTTSVICGTTAQTASTPTALPPRQDNGPSYAELTTAWTRLNPERDPTCFKEMKSVLQEFREIIKPLPHELSRANIARFRDHLIDRRLARATACKKTATSRPCCKSDSVPACCPETSHAVKRVTKYGDSARVLALTDKYVGVFIGSRTIFLLFGA